MSVDSPKVLRPDAVAAHWADTPRGNWLLTGSINSGKSRFLAACLEWLGRERPSVSVGGLLCEGLFFEESKIGYQGCDILTSERFLLGRRRELSPAQRSWLETLVSSAECADANGTGIGPWLLLESGMIRARQAIAAAVAARCDRIVVDEVGPLELGGGGLRCAVDALAASGIPMLLVARDSVAPELQKLYGDMQWLEIAKGGLCASFSGEKVP
jgi:nucleoside-triphosphatase THEP1